MDFRYVFLQYSGPRVHYFAIFLVGDFYTNRAVVLLPLVAVAVVVVVALVVVIVAHSVCHFIDYGELCISLKA